MQNKSEPILFFSFMIISLIGNACADYALLWFTIEQMDMRGNLLSFGDSTSLFYVGQAFGAILLAPYLSVYFDKLKKYISALALDFLYGSLLLVTLLFYRYDLLNNFSILVLVSFITMVSTTYRSSIAFTYIKKIESATPSLINYMIVSITISNMLGAALSGVFYSNFKLEGALIFGILTFLPSVLLYRKVFINFDKNIEIDNYRYIDELKSGYKVIKADKYILNVALSLAIYNVGGALIPVFLGINLRMNSLALGNDFGFIIATGLILGLLPLNIFKKKSSFFDISKSLAVSILPCFILVILTFILDNNSFLWIFIYFSACIGSTFRNVVTGQLRIIRIPKEYMSRVNTLYTSILYLGQVVGGLFLIPYFKKSQQFGSIIIAILFMVSILWSIFNIPKKNLMELKKI